MLFITSGSSLAESENEEQKQDDEQIANFSIIQQKPFHNCFPIELISETSLKPFLLKYFSCSINRGLLVQPKHCQCGCDSMFCEECIQNHNYICPISQTNVQNQLISAPTQIFKLLEETNILCVNTSQGCTWKGSFQTLELHLQTNCNYQPFQCNFCNKQITRNQIKQHWANECEQKQIQCSICNACMLRKELFKHFEDNKMKHFDEAYERIKVLEERAKTLEEDNLKYKNPFSSFFQEQVNDDKSNQEKEEELFQGKYRVMSIQKIFGGKMF